jgi:hypothetical protein
MSGGSVSSSINRLGEDKRPPLPCPRRDVRLGTFQPYPPSLHFGPWHKNRCTWFIGKDWLRIAAWAARKAELNYESLKKGDAKGSADKELRTAKAEDLLKQARSARDRLRTTLQYLAGGIPTWAQRVESAYAAPETQTPVADTLVALCDIGAEMLADKSAGMKARRDRSKLDAAAIKRYREIASAAASAVREASGVAPASAVTQADVDLWDGIAIAFFEQLVDALEQAREEDPTIPAPSIIGLRGWFRRLSRKERGEAEAGDGEGGDAAQPGGG